MQKRPRPAHFGAGLRLGAEQHPGPAPGPGPGLMRVRSCSPEASCPAAPSQCRDSHLRLLGNFLRGLPTSLACGAPAARSPRSTRRGPGRSSRRPWARAPGWPRLAAATWTWRGQRLRPLQQQQPRRGGRPPRCFRRSCQEGLSAFSKAGGTGTREPQGSAHRAACPWRRRRSGGAGGPVQTPGPRLSRLVLRPPAHWGELPSQLRYGHHHAFPASPLWQVCVRQELWRPW